MKRLPRPAPVPLAVRVVVLAAGVTLALAPERLTTASVVAVLTAVVAGLLAPRGVGSVPASAVFVLVWVVATGWGDVPSVARTVVAAAALYVLHSAMALAACLPVDADVSREVVTRWLRRSTLPLALAVVVVVVDQALPLQGGSAVLELFGLVGVVLVAGGVGLAVLRRHWAPDRMNGRGSTSTGDGIHSERPQQMGDHQAQEGRDRRQARQALREVDQEYRGGGTYRWR